SGAGGEGTDLVLVLRPFGVGAEDAELGLGDRGEVRFESEHLLGAAQTQGRPAGSVVDPLMVDDVGGLDPEGRDDPCEKERSELAGARPSGGGERQRLRGYGRGRRPTGSADVAESGPAFLDHAVRVPR